MVKILFVGDIVGKGGRKAVARLVPELIEEYKCDFCIANGENMAGGSGMTEKCVAEIHDSMVDVVTGGDHMWDQRDFVNAVDNMPRVLRPANVFCGQPGSGYRVYPGGDDQQQIAVISLIGRVFMKNPADCPFQAADRILEKLDGQTKNIIVDFHAEATSEKIALGRYLDGRVSAVFGTHTHVATADQCVFPKGTAFQCDVGMVGARESVLGREIEPVVKRFSTGMPARFKVAKSGIRLNATAVRIDEEGHARSIERVLRDLK